MVWSVPQRITGDADVSQEGTLLGAYAFGGTSGAGTTVATVNGVPFVSAMANATQGAIATSGAQYAFGGFGGGSNAPFSQLSSSYRTLLSKGLYGGANTITLTITGTPGQTYLLQFWLNDSRGNPGTSRHGSKFTHGQNVSPIVYAMEKAATPGSVGESVKGYLTLAAGESSAAITLAGAGGASLINALQIRTAPAGKASWMAAEKYGIMLHYMAGGVLPPPQGPPPNYSVSAEIPAGATTSPWSDAVDGFQAEDFADQAAASGAGYVIFALGQTSGYYCSPNAAYETLGPINPGEFTSVRDLISDVADALAKRGIKTIVYVAADGPRSATTIRRATSPTQVKMQEKTYAVAAAPPYWPAGANATFRTNLNNMIREWSLRWGTRVSGWWIDGCFADTGYGALAENGDGPGNLAAMIQAAKAGNPDSLVAVNPGADVPVTGNYGVLSPEQDYMAGEAASHHNAYAKFSRYPTSQFVTLGGKNILWHTLSYVGMNWRTLGQKYVNEELISYIDAVNRVGGVVTLDVAFEADGTIVDQHFNQLKAVKAALKPAAPPAVVPQNPPTFVNLALFKPSFSRSNNPGEYLLQPSGGQYTAHAAVDGDLATRAQAGGEYPWNFTVDLEAVKNFDRVVVHFLSDSPSSTYEIRYSTTGYTGTAGNWQLINSTQPSHSGITAGANVFNTDGMKSGRFLRIKATTPNGHPQMAIGEFEVYNVSGSAQTSEDTVWVDEKYPALAAATTGGFGGSWLWASVMDPLWSTYNNPYPKDGLKIHWSPTATGWNEHGFTGAQAPLKVAGESLYCDVWIDPAAPADEIMLTWEDSSGSVAHRAFWGSDLLSFGTPGTASRRYVGPLPPAGKWVRLTVPVSEVGLTNATIKGMSCATFNGRVLFDRAGRTTKAVYSSSVSHTLTAAPGNGTVTLEWNPVVGASSYNVYIALAPGGPYTPVTSVTSPQFVDTGRTNGTSYYYVVAAVVNGVQGPNSPESKAIPKP